MSDEDTPIVISQNTIKRLIRDVRSLQANPLTEHGIYYEHSDTDILKGQALIIGPADTPYHDGFYLFDFDFPPDYPHRPPKVKFCTNDGVTRMNPNLYKCGKVCVSILNTWRGPAWTGCQTISTVLLTLVSILNSTPLLNEPGVEPDHPDTESYQNIIRYKNFDTAILSVLECESQRKHFSKFISNMEAHFLKNYKSITKRLNKYAKSAPTHAKSNIYVMNILLDYQKTKKGIKNIYEKLTKLK
mgnify:CR=1 FL=1